MSIRLIPSDIARLADRLDVSRSAIRDVEALSYDTFLVTVAVPVGELLDRPHVGRHRRTRPEDLPW